jgi:hypothetical protein
MLSGPVPLQDAVISTHEEVKDVDVRGGRDLPLVRRPPMAGHGNTPF